VHGVYELFQACLGGSPLCDSCIAQTLVEQVGGRITAESTPGKGSTFSVWLPLAGLTRLSPSPSVMERGKSAGADLQGNVIGIPTLAASQCHSW